MKVINFSAVSSNTWYGKALRLPLRLIPGGVMLPILQGPLVGEKWIVGSSVHACWLGSYEIEKCRLIQQAVRAGSTFFDVGAQAGYHTLLASRLVGPYGRVFAFEPAPRNIRYLRKLVAGRNLDNVAVVEAAVCDHNGAAAFETGPSCVAGHLAETGDLLVRTVSLDEEIAQGRLPPPDYIKIDVEGAEMNVLMGAQTLLRERHPALFIDTHSFLGPQFAGLHEQCCNFLRTVGYELRPILGRGLEQTSQVYAWRS